MEEETLDEKFFKYHEANPQVYSLFLGFVKKARSAGHKHYSIDAIMHQVRWHMNVETRDSEGFKMNNNYTSRYARLLVKLQPNLDGFFRNRKLKTASTLE